MTSAPNSNALRRPTFEHLCAVCDRKKLRVGLTVGDRMKDAKDNTYHELQAIVVSKNGQRILTEPIDGDIGSAAGRAALRLAHSTA